MKVIQQISGASLPGMIRCGVIALCLSAPYPTAGEETMPCAVSSDTNLPFFGDLHIHTRYSFDSYLSNQKNDPDGASQVHPGRQGVEQGAGLPNE